MLEIDHKSLLIVEFGCFLLVCVHTRSNSGKFENGAFTLETHQRFCRPHYSRKKIVNTTINGHFGFAFEENSSGEIRFMCHRCFRKAPGPFLRFKERFRDGLVWTVGQILEIKLRFEISLAVCLYCLSSSPITNSSLVTI